MPQRPPRICNAPGCSTATTAGYCLPCSAKRGRRREANRPSAAARGYGGRWRQAREGYLRRHPLCLPCSEQGRTEPATVVDHIIDHKGDRALFWDSSNWQPLCKRCHDRKTARTTRFGRMAAPGSVPGSAPGG